MMFLVANSLSGKGSSVTNLASRNLSIAKLVQMSNLPASSPILVAVLAHKSAKSNGLNFSVRLKLPTQDPGAETEDNIGDLMPPFVTVVEKCGQEERRNEDVFTPVWKMPCVQDEVNDNNGKV